MAKIVPDSVDSYSPALPNPTAASAPITITYTYDPFNRLITANQ